MFFILISKVISSFFLPGIKLHGQNNYLELSVLAWILFAERNFSFLNEKMCFVSSSCFYLIEVETNVNWANENMAGSYCLTDGRSLDWIPDNYFDRVFLRKVDQI